jgi:hypothetical protein
MARGERLHLGLDAEQAAIEIIEVRRERDQQIRLRLRASAAGLHDPRAAGRGAPRRLRRGNATNAASSRASPSRE